MRITMIMNPPDMASVEALREEVERLRSAGHTISPFLTFEKGDAEQLAVEGVREKSDLVIAAGGDGTLNQVANGLYSALAEQSGPAPRLGIIPLGTGNDLAAGLEIPMALPEAIKVAVEGRAMEIDVGMVGGRCFLNVSTGGFGAEATGDTGSGAKRLLGPLAYAFSGAKKFATGEPSAALFAAGDGGVVYEGTFMLFAIGNGRRTGGGNWLTPRADLADGLLDLCIVKEIPRQEFVTLSPHLRSGNHLDRPAVLYHQAPTIQVRSYGELSVNADGEPLDGKEFSYSIAPRRLSVMVPDSH